MKEAVTKVIDTLTQEDFHGALHKLLERYKCIAAGGYYFEGDYSFMFVLSIKGLTRKKSGNLFNDPRTSNIFTRKDCRISLRNRKKLFFFSLVKRIFLYKKKRSNLRIILSLISMWLTHSVAKIHYGIIKRKKNEYLKNECIQYSI